MKLQTIKGISIAIIIILVVIAAYLLGASHFHDKPQVAISGQGSSTQNSIAPIAQNMTQSVMYSGSASKTATNLQQSYLEYLNQLHAEQNACKNAASIQYDKYYADSLQSSSFESFYNQNTGKCYMNVSGVIHPEYSTSTTATQYFRDVTHSVLLAECTDSIGITFSDSEWSCSDKITSNSINRAQLNAMILKYTAQ